MENLYELTNPQKSIWLTEQYYKGTSINDICGTAKLNFKIDFDTLCKAINLVIQKNDCFRLKFNIKNGIVKQYISDYKFINIEIINIEDEKDISSIQKNLINKVFDIENDYLFQFKIYRLPNEKGGFILNIHHILSDSWSLGLICKEIIKSYNYLMGISPEEPISSSYEDFCVAEKKYLQSDKFEKDREYWNSTFNTIPEVASIPSISKSYEDISCKANRKTFVINEKLNSKINTYCRENKISAYNFFLSVYALYIGRVSNLSDFVIGTPILNRTNYKEKNTIGMFISTQPLRINIENSKSFVDLASNIASNCMSMLRHQRYPYENILQDLRKQNNNLPNLYNILLSYQITKADTAGTDYSTEWSFNGNCADELQIHIEDLNNIGSLNVCYDYKTQKFTDKEILDIHNRVLFIINQVIENPKIELNNIEIVTKEEKDELLYKFNNTKLNYDKTKTIAELFEEQAKKTPNNIALVFEDQTLTYKELNEKANQFAHYIKSSNYDGNTVGVLLNRSLDLIITILAIVKNGLTYLPIDPEYPNDRINYMLQDSNCKLVFVNNKTNKIIENKNIMANIDEINTTDFSTSNLLLPYLTSNIAYLIYTSGSTGKPKGVMVTYDNLHNFILGINNKISINSQKTVVSLTTVSFDIFGLELWCSLLNGSKLVVASELEQNSPMAFNNLCLKNNVNIIQTTPSRYNLFLNSSSSLEFLNNITEILIGGEAVPISLLRKFQSLSTAKIYNVYGPTETTIWSTLKDITTDSDISIGKPIANTQCYILDKNLNILPTYTPGHLYISGYGVSNGYLNRDDLNNEKFTQSPFNANSKIYDTGDLAYYTENGNIIHLGRSDSQVKLRGYRIELGEVENSISNFTNIQNCAVIIKNNKLYGFYTKKANSLINTFELKQFLLDELPSYMIPTGLFELEQMPFTPNGKIDRKALIVPDINTNKNLELPNTTTEKKIFNIISAIVNNTDFDINTDFFTIGLDSLNIIQISSKIIEEFNTEIAPSQLYKLLSIKKLAEFIDNNSTNSYNIQHLDTRSEYYELSSAQKRIYYASKVSSNDLIYNICGGLLFNTILDKSKTEKIFNQLIAKHSSFRTCFKIIDGIPKQYILNFASIHVDEVKTTDKEVQNIINEFPKAFNLEVAPLLRVKLYYINNEQTLLLIDSHHIILDGTSLQLLINEFCRMYNNNSTINCEIDYKDFSIWENNYNSSSEYRTLENNWKEKFNNIEIPVINLPYDFPISQQRTFNGNTLHTTIFNETFEKIEVLSKKYNVTPYVFCLTVFYVLLYRYTGQNNIIIGSPISGRFSKELENIIGMFVNNIPLQIQIDSNTNFEKLLELVKENVLFAMQNQPYPYDALVKLLNINSNTNLFDVMFTFQNENNNLPEINGSTPEILYANTKTSKFNLSLEIIPNTHTLNLEYNTDLFKENTAQKILSSYITVLDNIINKSDILIKNIDILDNNEKNKVLYEFNNTNFKYDNSTTIAELFEKQVEMTPNNIAIKFENAYLTFKELNEKANSLAYHLRSSGITRNNIIGIMCNRSLELIVGILASLKCGCCYIPIDPSFPKERISYMLENSNSKILLSTNNIINKINFDNKLSIDLNNSIYLKNKGNLEKITNPDDNSYIIYTSGSTGKPKGVVLKQKSLTNLAYHFNNSLEFFKTKNKPVMASVTTASFDIFLFETIISLQAGLTVIIANEDEQRIPSKLNMLIQNNNIEAIQMTPSRMQFFVDNIEDIPLLKKLQYVTLAGEPLSKQLVDTLKKIGIKKIYNGYGPSETTVFSTYTDVTSHEKITIGKPLSNTQTYILDNDLKPCPIGVSGELYISGDGVGNGYFNNIELTEKCYIPNPFVKNSTMYKVGDLCKWLENGEILCLGRKDNQIKIRGLRIELGEIENRILQFTSIQKCVVVKQQMNSREFISAYYIANSRIRTSELRKFIAEKLPNYMIPSYFIALDEFPYTPNGKIDKKSLPLPKINKEKTDKFIAPKTDLEIKLAKIFENILSTSPIGVTDNFFELGGDSILAMKLNIELLKISDKITYSDIFDNPTITDLINLINSNNLITDSSDIDIDNSKYEELLHNNIVIPSTTISKKNNNLLLSGATGFLGIHILASYLDNNLGKIYCLIRSEPGITSETKLLNKLHYYFGNKYDNSINKKIFIINGDISKEKFGISESQYYELSKNVDIVINSAAKVDHFGKYETFYNINVNGVQNIIDFCLLYEKRFYQISTLSVSGNSFVDSYAYEQNFSDIRTFSEDKLFIGQTLNNVYVKTKFEAEKLVLDNIIDNNLDGYILRVGNLMPRLKDGKFQQNIQDNAYLNRLAAFLKIGYIPHNISNAYLEFTPIDCCADSIIKLIPNSNRKNRIFHLYNHNHLYLTKLLDMLKDLKHPIKVVDEETFKNIIKSILNDENKKDILSNLSNDFGKNLSLNYESNIKITSEFTIKFLDKLNFSWPEINAKYLTNILELLKKVGN